MKRTVGKVLAIVGALIGISSFFLPWVSFELWSERYGLSGLDLIRAFFGNTTGIRGEIAVLQKPLPLAILLTVAFLGLILSLIFALTLTNHEGESRSNLPLMMAGVLTLLIVAAIGIVLTVKLKNELGVLFDLLQEVVKFSYGYFLVIFAAGLIVLGAALSTQKSAELVLQGQPMEAYGYPGSPYQSPNWKEAPANQYGWDAPATQYQQQYQEQYQQQQPWQPQPQAPTPPQGGHAQAHPMQPEWGSSYQTHPNQPFERQEGFRAQWEQAQQNDHWHGNRHDQAEATGMERAPFRDHWNSMDKPSADLPREGFANPIHSRIEPLPIARPVKTDGQIPAWQTRTQNPPHWLDRGVSPQTSEQPQHTQQPQPPRASNDADIPEWAKFLKKSEMGDSTEAEQGIDSPHE